MIITGTYTQDDWFGVVRVDGEILDPTPSQKVYNHSPDGFAWGYDGSGPAQLALAILLKAGLSDMNALKYYQLFKRQYISRLERDSFELNVDVKHWFNQQKRGNS